MKRLAILALVMLLASCAGMGTSGMGSSGTGSAGYGKSQQDDLYRGGSR